MLNIRWKGTFSTKEELTCEKSLPDGAVMFKEGKTIQDAFVKGFVLILPLWNAF